MNDDALKHPKSQAVMRLKEALYQSKDVIDVIWEKPLGDKVLSLHVSDIDKDGLVEILFGSDDSYIYVLDSLGELKWKFKADGPTRGICTADIDEDGIIEVFVGSEDNFLYVLDDYGKLKWKYDAGGWVRSVCVGDVDGDGRLEVILGSANGIHILGCSGSVKAVWELGSVILKVLVADVSGNGQAEILVGLEDGMRVIQADGSVLWYFGDEHWIRAIYVVDIDGDGGLDILVGSDSHNMYMLNSKGAVIWHYKANGVIFDAVCEDVDSDGRKEVIFSSQDRHFYIFDNRGVLKWKHNAGDWVRAIAVADIDKDTNMELLVGTEGDFIHAFRMRHLTESLYQKIIQAYENAVALNSNTELALSWEDWQLLESFEAKREIQQVWSDDLDNVLRSGNYKNALSQLLRLKNSPLVMLWQHTVGDTIRSLFVADIDKDGYPEIIVGSEDKNVHVVSYKGESKGNYLVGNKVFGVYSLDIDSDGINEIIIGSEDNRIYALKNDSLLWEYPTGGRVRCVFAADINRDNSPEIIASSEDHSVYVLSAQGELEWSYQTGGRVRAVIAVDANQDGNFSVIATSEDHYVYVLDNLGVLIDRFNIEEKAFGLQVWISDDINQPNKIITGSDDNFVRAINSNGILEWMFETHYWIRSIFLADIDGNGGKEILVCSEDRNLYAFDLSGKLLWQHQLSDKGYAISACDIDHDNTIEIIIGTFGAHIQVYKVVSHDWLESVIKFCWDRLISESGKNELDLLRDTEDENDIFIRGYALRTLLKRQKLDDIGLDFLTDLVTIDSDALVLELARGLSDLLLSAPKLVSQYFERLAEHRSTEVKITLLHQLPDILRTETGHTLEDFSYALSSLAKESNQWVRQALCRSLACLLPVYPKQVFELSLLLIHDENSWAQHEVARLLSGFFASGTTHSDVLDRVQRIIQSQCKLKILSYLSKLSQDHFARKLFSALYDAYSPKLPGHVILAKHALVELTLPPSLLTPVAIEVIEMLGHVTDFLVKMESADSLQGKLEYALRAINDLEATSNILVLHDNEVERVLISPITSHWRQIISNTLANLQRSADLHLSLVTLHIPRSNIITVVVSIENKGLGLAENVEVEITSSNEYVRIIHKQQLPRVFSKHRHQLEFKIEPLVESNLRIVGVLKYNDLVNFNIELPFAERISLFEPKFAQFNKLEPNPYIIGRPLRTQEMFVGRKGVFEYIKENLEGKHQDNIIVLHGQRKTGKSSLLYQLTKQLGEPYIYILIDIQGMLDPGTPAFLYSIASAIYKTVRSEGFPLPKPQLTAFQLQPGIYFREQFLPELFNVVGDRRIILMFDEFELLEDKIKQGILQPSLLDYLRNLMQYTEQLGFIFAGAQKLEQMSGDYWSILFNMALYKKISFLDMEETRQLITMPVTNFFEYDELAIEKIVQATAGHPHFTQFLCHGLVNYRNTHKLNYIALQHVNEVIDEVIETGGIHLNYIWRQSTSEEKAFLVALNQVLKKNGVASFGSIEIFLNSYNIRLSSFELVKNLIGRDIIDESDGHYTFSFNLVRGWIEKNMDMHRMLRETKL